MTLLVPAHGGFGWSYTNQGTPTLTPGTSVIPGASDAEGAWTQIATAANIAEDVYGILLVVSGGATAAAGKLHLLDIGTDPAGGVAYAARVSNLQCGLSSAFLNQRGIALYVPVFIPAGSAVAVRIQGNQATAGTVAVWATFYGRPLRPEFTQKLTRAETLGTITGSLGVVVAPGAAAAEGAWVEIGTTTFPWRYILPTYQISDNVIGTDQVLWLDVAQGDDTNKTVVAEHILYNINTAEACSGGPGLNAPDLWCDIKSGARIFARLSSSAATPDANNAVLVTGLG